MEANAAMKKLKDLLIDSFFTIALTVGLFIPFMAITAIYHGTQNSIIGFAAIVEGLLALCIVTPMIHDIIQEVSNLFSHKRS